MRLIRNVFQLLFVTSMLCFAGCDDDDAKTDSGILRISNVSNSGCKKYVPQDVNGLLPLSEEESVTFKGLDGGKMRITHTNAIFNCEHERIDISVSRADNQITVTENEINPSANCVCAFDISYDINGLENGQEYLLVIKNGDTEVSSMTFIYNTLFYKKLLIEK